MPDRTIPCADCQQWRTLLEAGGHQVTGCVKSATANMCTISYAESSGMLGAAPALFASPAPAAPAKATASAAEPWKKVAEAIVNIFETGSALGNYGAVTLIPHDSGHLTYGRSQTTLGSGNLYLL